MGFHNSCIRSFISICRLFKNRHFLGAKLWPSIQFQLGFEPTISRVYLLGKDTTQSLICYNTIYICFKTISTSADNIESTKTTDIWWLPIFVLRATNILFVVHLRFDMDWVHSSWHIAGFCSKLLMRLSYYIHLPYSRWQQVFFNSCRNRTQDLLFVSSDH